jgi:hypothetical protein
MVTWRRKPRVAGERRKVLHVPGRYGAVSFRQFCGHDKQDLHLLAGLAPAFVLGESLVDGGERLLTRCGNVCLGPIAAQEIRRVRKQTDAIWDALKLLVKEFIWRSAG